MFLQGGQMACANDVARSDNANAHFVIVSVHKLRYELRLTASNSVAFNSQGATAAQAVTA